METNPGFMNWVDNVREQMAEVAERAQDPVATDAGISFRRRYDELTKQLGELVYSQHALGETPDRAAGIAAITDAIDELMQEHEVIDLRQGNTAKAK